MSTQREKQEAAQRLGAVESMLQRAKRDRFGDGGLAYHAQELRQNLSKMEVQTGRAGKVVLTFDGPPVHGQQGIKVSFAGKVLESFQKLVGAFSGINADLFVTAPAVGSYGFVLEEIGQLALDNRSPVAESLDQLSTLLHTLTKRDMKGIEQIEAKHKSALRDFLKIVSAAGARTKLASGNVVTAFTSDDARWVAELVDRITERESAANIPGRLVGVLPFKRQFEFLSQEDLAYSGAIAQGLDIAKQVKPWDGKACVVRIATITTEYPSGYTRRAFRLDGVDPFDSGTGA